MQAISVKQPWANLIAAGRKTIETRTWMTNHRGPLLIVASRRPTGMGPTGVMICVVDVVDCRAMLDADWPAACCEVYPGAWAWVLANVRRVRPIAVRGQLRLFEVEDGLIEEVGSRK